MNKPTITIINDKHVRGIIAPAGAISQETLEDMIDLVEMSSVESVKGDNRRIAEADTKNSWIPFEQVKKQAKKAR